MPKASKILLIGNDAAVTLIAMQREQIVSYFFVGLFLFVLYQIVRIFSPFFSAISWAAILAFAFYPLYQKILTSTKLNSSIVSFLMTCLVVLIVVIPSAIIVISLMKEAIDLYYHVSNYITSGKLEQFILQIRETARSEWTQQFWLRWDPLQEELSNTLLQAAKGMGNFAAVQLTALTKNVFFWVVNLVFIAFLLFFFFRDGKAIYEFIYQLVPMAHKNKAALSKKINETFAAVIRGQFVTCIIQATVAGFTFWVLAIPLPFFLAFLTFITCLIPVTGAATVWVPVVIYLFATHAITKAVILLIVGIFVISLSDNFLKPILIGGKTQLPVVFLFLGILGGVKIYGIIGLFLGPIILSLFFVLTQIYREEYQSISTR